MDHDRWGFCFAEGVCSQCGLEINGPPVVDSEQLDRFGHSPEWCSVECQDNAAEAAGMRAYAAAFEDGGGMSETYRRDMIDAGRGHLVR